MLAGEERVSSNDSIGGRRSQVTSTGLHTVQGFGVNSYHDQQLVTVVKPNVGSPRAQIRQKNSSSADFINSLIKLKSSEHNRQMLQLKRFSKESDFSAPVPDDNVSSEVDQDLITVGRQTQFQNRHHQQNVRGQQQLNTPFKRENKSRQRPMAIHNISIMKNLPNKSRGPETEEKQIDLQVTSSSQKVVTQEFTVLSSHAVVPEDNHQITQSRLNDPVENQQAQYSGAIEVTPLLEDDDHKQESDLNTSRDQLLDGVTEGKQKQIQWQQRDTSFSLKDQRPDMAELRMMVGDSNKWDKTGSPQPAMQKSDSFASTLLVNNPQFKGNSSGFVATRQISYHQNPPIGEQQMSELLMEDSSDNFQKTGRAVSLPQATLLRNIAEVTSGQGTISKKPIEVRDLLDSGRKMTESRDSPQHQQFVIIENNEFVETENMHQASTHKDNLLEPLDEEEQSVDKPSDQLSRKNIRFDGAKISNSHISYSNEKSVPRLGGLSDNQSSLVGDNQTLSRNNSQKKSEVVLSSAPGLSVFIDKKKEIKQKEQSEELKKYLDSSVLPLATHVKQRPHRISPWLQKSKNLQSFTSKLTMNSRQKDVNSSTNIQEVRNQAKKFLQRSTTCSRANGTGNKSAQVAKTPMVDRMAIQKHLMSQAQQKRVVLLSNANGTSYSFRKMTRSQMATGNDLHNSSVQSSLQQTSRKTSICGTMPSQEPFLQPTQVYLNQNRTNEAPKNHSKNNKNLSVNDDAKSRFQNEYRQKLLDNKLGLPQAPQALSVEGSDLTDRVDLMRALLNTSSDEDSDHYAPLYAASTAQLIQDQKQDKLADSASDNTSEIEVAKKISQQATGVQASVKPQLSLPLNSKKFKQLTQKVYQMDVIDQQLSTNRQQDDQTTLSPSKRSDSKQVLKISNVTQPTQLTNPRIDTVPAPAKLNEDSFQIVVLKNNLPDIDKTVPNDNLKFNSKPISTLHSMPKMTEQDRSNVSSRANEPQQTTVRTESSFMPQKAQLDMLKIGTKQEKPQKTYQSNWKSRRRESSDVRLMPIVSKNATDLAIMCMIEDKQSSARRSSALSQNGSLDGKLSSERMQQHRQNKRSTAEVAPWNEGSRHLNFSQRYRQNQVNVSRATYGLQTSQLKDFNSKMIQTPDFSLRQQAHLARKGLKSQQAVKLVSYRSQTSSMSDRRQLAVSRGTEQPVNHWAQLDETRDLGDLQKSQRSIQYVDLVQQKNLQFHRKSEVDQFKDRESENSIDDQLRASYFPSDVAENHQSLIYGLRASTLKEDYEQSQKEKRLQKKRDIRLGRLKNQKLPQSKFEKSVIGGNIETKSLFKEQTQVTKYLLSLQRNPKLSVNKIEAQKQEKQCDGEEENGKVKFLDSQHLPPTQKDLKEKYTFRKPSKGKRRCPKGGIYVPKNEIVNISSQESTEGEASQQKLRSHQITLTFTQDTQTAEKTVAIDFNGLPLLYKDNQLCPIEIIDSTQTAVRSSTVQRDHELSGQDSSKIKKEQSMQTYASNKSFQEATQVRKENQSNQSDAESLLKEEHVMNSARLQKFEAAIPQCEQPKYKMKQKVKSGRTSTDSVVLRPLPFATQAIRASHLSQPRLSEEQESESQKSINMSSSVGKVIMAHKYSFQNQKMPSVKPVDSIQMSYRNESYKQEKFVTSFDRQQNVFDANDQAIAQVNKDLTMGMFGTTSYDSSEVPSRRSGLVGQKRQGKSGSSTRKKESRSYRV